MDGSRRISLAAGGRRRTSAAVAMAFVLALGLVFGITGFARPANASSSLAPNNQAATPMPAMPGMTAAVPITPTTGSDVEALMGQMQEMMRSLQGMMGQLQQKSAAPAILAPTATPTRAPALNTQAMMSELQDLNRLMGPLMLRMQADMQGSPSAEELASISAQVEQLAGRMNKLMAQMQAARSGTAPQPAPLPAPAAMPAMPVVPATSLPAPLGAVPATGPNGSGASGQSSQRQYELDRVQQMLNQMQSMLNQMQGQSAPAAAPMSGMSGMVTPAPTGGQQGGMSGMQMGGTGNMAVPSQAPGTSSMTQGNPTAQATPMPGMSGSAMPMDAMDSMMSMMDNMMSMMDSMMGGMSGSGGGMGMGMGGMSGSGNNMPMPTPTPGGMGGMGDM